MPLEVTPNAYLHRRPIEPMPDPHKVNLPSHDDHREPGVWIVLIVVTAIGVLALLGAALGLSGGLP